MRGALGPTSFAVFRPPMGSIVYAPNCRLCPVLNSDLAKDCLDVDLHGRLGDIDLARYALVGVAFDDAAQNHFLLRRKQGRGRVFRRNQDWLAISNACRGLDQMAAIGIEYQ